MAGKTIAERKSEPWRIRLRHALEVRNLSFKDLSIRCGHNEEFISKTLNGRLNPSVSAMLEICKVAGIRPTYLFEAEEDDSTIVSAIEVAKNLSENEAELVKRLLASARND